MPDVLKAWVNFALAKRELPFHLIDDTQQAVDLSNQAAVDAWIEQVNQRPFRARDQILCDIPASRERLLSRCSSA